MATSSWDYESRALERALETLDTWMVRLVPASPDFVCQTSWGGAAERVCIMTQENSHQDTGALKLHGFSGYWPALCPLVKVIWQGRWMA